MTFEHYTTLLVGETAFLTWTKNSLLVSVPGDGGLSVVIGTVAAYALARLRFFAVGGPFGTGIFVTYLVPTDRCLFLPLARSCTGLGWGDSKWALGRDLPHVPGAVLHLAPHGGTSAPCRRRSRSAPWSVAPPAPRRADTDRAADRDPGLVCAILFAFTLSWNEFIYALTFKPSSSDEITASVGVTSELIRGQTSTSGALLMAGAVLGSVPIVILYVFFLDYYVSGLTTSARWSR